MTASFANLPVVGPDDAAAIPAIIADIERTLAPSSEEQIDRMVTKIALLFPAVKLSEKEAGARMELYVDLLSDIPFDILSGAFRVVAQRSRFFPTVAEIREAAAKPLAERKGQVIALRQLRMKHDREWRDPVAVMNSQDRAECSEILNATIAKLRANA